jgi:hypothetical protein
MINPLAPFPALIARAVHEVVTEYRRLDAPEAPAAAVTEHDCTQARVETTWQPASARSRPVMGFASLAGQFDDPALTGTD